ncbi:ABC transporter ATP-binding protein [Nocardia wallacei]|uniref:ABC transporter ATP-binding protein n=1 Tax=Nocardia wallacei TaxID=480035 RepID=UPI0024554D2E|nr:ATP-binding cassette domain-containing protein [Nocardia wallacei]
MPSLLEVDDVSVVFGGNRALDGAGLRAERGAVTGLIGPNGAGKSTLFDVVCGLRRPTGGRVAIDGRDVTRFGPARRAPRGRARPVQRRGRGGGGASAGRAVTRCGPARRARHGLARTFQRLELFGRLTVRDNLLVAAELGGNRRQAAGIVTGIIDRLGLHEVADTSADALPTGTARLVEVGRAIAARPSLILLDEPAAGQNHSETALFGDLLRSLAADGTAVLLVEHDMGLVMNVCDEVYVLDLGKVIASGPPAVIREDQVVRAAYLGDI